ncbi:MAG TPA: hypothetical protein VKC60_15880, partial [Opitutaceae bacterium]|nr:hypothetical protein [Opitutaceae bacterium]
MPYTVFPSAIGTCGLAWNEIGLTGFQLPSADEAVTAHRLKAEPNEPPATTLPASIASVIEKAQRHLRGELQDFSDLPYDFSTVSPFQKSVYVT